jgi:ribosome-binding protein aMBF1 (putative translation factor)
MNPSSTLREQLRHIVPDELHDRLEGFLEEFRKANNTKEGRVLGDKIREFRRNAELSLENLAGRVDCTVLHLLDIERNEVSPTPSLLERLQDVLPELCRFVSTQSCCSKCGR